MFVLQQMYRSMKGSDEILYSNRRSFGGVESGHLEVRNPFRCIQLQPCACHNRITFIKLMWSIVVWEGGDGKNVHTVHSYLLSYVYDYESHLLLFLVLQEREERKRKTLMKSFMMCAIVHSESSCIKCHSMYSCCQNVIQLFTFFWLNFSHMRPWLV